jgi:ribosomal protein L34
LAAGRRPFWPCWAARSRILRPEVLAPAGARRPAGLDCSARCRGEWSPRAPATTPMKILLRNSTTKHKRKNGFRSRQKTVGGRKINKRQRARHGAI